MFFPAYKGKLRHIGDSLSFKNYCFQNNTLTLVDRNEDSISLELTVSDAKSYLCNDIYLFFTSSIHQVKMVYFKGTYHITIDDLSTNQLTEIGSNGLRVFAFCDNVPRTLASAYKTAKFIMTNPAPEPGVPKPAKVLFDFPEWRSNVDLVGISHCGVSQCAVNIVFLGKNLPESHLSYRRASRAGCLTSLRVAEYN